MDDAVLGIDVGSQGCCASVFDAGGERLATAYHPHDVCYPRPGWAEQDPGDWLRSIEAAVLGALDDVPGERIRAIGAGSQLDGLVCVGTGGGPLGAAIIWMDRRADEECAGPAERVGEDEWYRRSGCNLDASHVAAKIAWLRRHDPERHRATRRYLLPGSFVVRALAGADAVDASNASSTMLLDPRRRDWDKRLAGEFGVECERLAPVRPPHEPVGTLRPEWAARLGLRPDTVVVVGCGDEMAATLGAGVVEPGWVCDVLGTAEPVCAVTSEPRFDPGRLVECHPHADPERWLLENPGWFSGGAYRWFRDELGGGCDYEGLNRLAATAPPGADGLVFLPAMMGATAPEWNGDARGVWYGLTPAHGRAHLVRALLEGSAYALRDNLEAMRRAGLEPERIVCTAGGARGHLLRQIRADVTGLAVAHSEDVETTARGAGMLAAAGAGLHASVGEAARAMCRIAGHEHRPDPAAREAYEGTYARYRQVYDALRPVFAAG